jgi:hypothetical protein
LIAGRGRRCWLPGICALVLATNCAVASLVRADDAAKAFENGAADIFARRCLNCHNSIDHKGDFSLQIAKELTESGAVEPGDAAESPLIEAITPQAGKRPAMPKGATPLTPNEVAVIRDWINAGAKWPDGFRIEEQAVRDFNWWSFKPIQRPDVPKIDASADAGWIRTPIDAFILAKLKERGLQPSKGADRRTLIRRLTYDLIGLPPTPKEIETFVNDIDPMAYERLVERLLASKHYGERWARHWLDVVKYADTCGYDKDKLRPNAWPYRDYVIRSFNNDKPYAQFVQEQIAGDVLFPGKLDGIVALGFVAAGPWDFIGHVEVPESKIDGRIARHLDRDEMVSNTLNTFCSLTVQCARCHNHKFDPFTQRHYYSLQAVFAAVDRAERPYSDAETEKRRAQLNEQLAQFRKRIGELETEIKRAGGEELVALEQQVADLRPKTKLPGMRPEFGYHSKIEKSPDTVKWVQIDVGREVDVQRVVLRPCHDDYANIGSGFGFPARFKVEASVSADFTKPIVLADETSADVPNPALAPYTIAKTTNARYVRVTATELAERSNDFMFALAEVEVFDGSGKNVATKATVTSLDSIEGPPRWRRVNLVDGIWPHAADPNAAIALEQANKKLQAIRDRINTPERRQRREQLDAQVKTTNGELGKLKAGQMVYAAATAFKPQGSFKPTSGKPRMIHVLHRGNILQPRGEVRPGRIPLAENDEFEFGLPKEHGESDRRAALAQWITNRNHPLTWRSIVNRVWLYHFGQGIVRSPNDFGRMGQIPTHPELLDWLATEFRDGGQSFKKLHRLIVTSSVYRQASAHDAAKATIDSGNQFLWRMNRRRLEAEEIRDSILAVSGRLDRAMGGPGYYLFALEKTAHSPHYEYHKFDPEDKRSHRRSVYRFIVRSQPDPFMTTLDCADSSQSTPKRDETLTSLQALSLLNNRFTLAMARHFAARVEAEQKEPSQQIQRAVWLTVGRKPTASEQKLFEAYALKHGLPNLCRVLFNLSEFVFLD